jgi:hypothetical protein
MFNEVSLLNLDITNKYIAYPTAAIMHKISPKTLPEVKLFEKIMSPIIPT